MSKDSFQLKPCERCTGKMEPSTSAVGESTESCRQCGHTRYASCPVDGCLGRIIRGRCIACQKREAWRVANTPKPLTIHCGICECEVETRNVKRKYCDLCSALAKEIGRLNANVRQRNKKEQQSEAELVLA